MNHNAAHDELPGIAFEKAVAAIQAQFDPVSKVTHNEVLVDRLGHSRQFDVVVRGDFAGQKMLGIIECKDIGKKVGTPEIDAFVTKAQDVNANFKIFMSRKGFSKPALQKCAHYGIQALSLLSDDPANRNVFIGTQWKVDLTRWGQIAITLHFVNPQLSLQFQAQDLAIDGRKVLDWFTNYLLDVQDGITAYGWVVECATVFEKAQLVDIGDGSSHLCSAISFRAERVCDKLERLVGISGTGFFDWQLMQAMFPPGAQLRIDAVPMDFSQWKPRSDQSKVQSGFFEIFIEAHSEFERVADAISLDVL